MHDLVPIFFMMTLLLTELTAALLPLGLPLPLGLHEQFYFAIYKLQIYKLFKFTCKKADL